MKLEELQVYNLSMEMGEKIWDIVNEWDHFKENINFSYYSRGSLFETKTWLTKAHKRKLIPKETFESFTHEIENIGVKLNNYIKSIGKTSTTE
jgi:hypothetical protein